MAWLIGERARIKGRIDRLQLLAERIPLELETLSQQLRSLDAVFPLHEVKVDPSVIRGKKKYAQKLLPHGAMTRGIYDCLRENSECGPVYSTEVMHFIARTNNLDIKAIGRERLLGQIAKRLGAMAKKGGDPSLP